MSLIHPLLVQFEVAKLLEIKKNSLYEAESFLAIEKLEEALKISTSSCLFLTPKDHSSLIKIDFGESVGSLKRLYELLQKGSEAL